MRGGRRALMWERRNQALAPRRVFLRRVGRNLLAAIVVVAVSLGIGMLGYHHFARLGWADAYVNAAMILSGMGPLATPQTLDAKLFAGTYALYCGLLVVFLAGVLLAPFAHRLLHRFHLDREQHATPRAGATSAPRKQD
jgi:sterol desaturase/sphingolipid hydroxylase (fatty acid hydroxylase superfamily)